MNKVFFNYKDSRFLLLNIEGYNKYQRGTIFPTNSRYICVGDVTNLRLKDYKELVEEKEYEGFVLREKVLNIIKDYRLVNEIYLL